MGKKPFGNKSKTLKFYNAKNDLWVFQAYNLGPTLRAIPDFLRSFLEKKDPIGHTSYRGDKKGFITSYLLEAEKHNLEFIAKNQGFSAEFRKPSEQNFPEVTDLEYNIFFKHINVEGLNKTFRDIQRDDIVDFCKKEAKEFDNKKNNIEIVNKIVPNPRFTLQKPFAYQVVKFGKGTSTKDCVLDIGFDFSLGCLSNISNDWYYDPQGSCSYCYAYQNGPCFLDSHFDIDEKELREMIEEKKKKIGIEEKNVINLRFGQSTEVWVPKKFRDLPGFKDNFLMGLETVIRMQEDYAKKGQKINLVIPTKTPKYDPRSSYDRELAKLLKKSGASVFASFAYLELEPELNNHGFTVDKRLQEILNLAKAGVNSHIYVATDVTRPINEMQPDAKKALKFFYEHRGKLGLQFLDIRITKKKDAEIIGGNSWSCLKDTPQQDILLPEKNWHLTGQGYLAANFVHPDYQNLAKNNNDIRICYTHSPTGKGNYCGRCFVDKS